MTRTQEKEKTLTRRRTPVNKGINLSTRPLSDCILSKYIISTHYATTLSLLHMVKKRVSNNQVKMRVKVLEWKIEHDENRFSRRNYGSGESL